MTLPRLDPDGEKILALAAEKSSELGTHHLGVEHLFLALADVEGELLTHAFSTVDMDLTEFVGTLRRALINAQIGVTPPVALTEHVTPRCDEVLELADRLASRDVAAVGPRHILLAIFREGRSVPLRMLAGLDVAVADVRDAVEKAEPQPEATPTPLLDRFGRDLTLLAQRGKLSPVIGRAQEMQLLSEVLLRKNKNNPVLVGEPGVGKTAVVEGFAQRLLAEDCPEPLRGRRIVELSLGTLVAGTKFRGEFEERLTEITKELAAHPEILLFFDEIHALVGAGATGGGDSLDAANIFKPALARGEIKCIGATTINEYRRYIERDAALDRRFEKILVDEPTADEAREILTRLRPSLEEHHGLTIDVEAVEAAVALTVRHVFDRNLPDKAIDALDQSCARLRLRRLGSEGEATTPRVGAAEVETTVSQWTGIPLERLSGEAARDLLELEGELRSHVVGQDRAVAAVTRTILTAKAGLSDPKRPLGVFFFAGPTGVGKTHLAQTLAEQLFGDARRLVRIDMSEYMQEHAVSNLIGAPPGYVGHEKEGTLISALRTHPHCVVLFDEVEKAHPRVFDLFLQIFDEGRLTGTHGKSADFTQAVVILTSNLPLSVAQRSVGFDVQEAPTTTTVEPRDALLEHLRPELVNRIDEVVVFDPLPAPALRRIVDGYLADLAERLAERKVSLVLAPEVYGHLLERADTDTYGARELRRLVDRLVRQPLATRILELGGEPGSVHVRLEGDELRFEAVREGTMA